MNTDDAALVKAFADADLATLFKTLDTEPDDFAMWSISYIGAKRLRETIRALKARLAGERYHYTRDSHGIIEAVCKMFERGTFLLGEGDALIPVQEAYEKYKEFHNPTPSRTFTAEAGAGDVADTGNVRRHTAECAIHRVGTIKSCDCMPFTKAELLDLYSEFPTVTFIHNETPRGRDEMVNANIVRRLLNHIRTRAPMPPEIAEIENRHLERKSRWQGYWDDDGGGMFMDITTLLAYIRTQQADSCSPRRTAAPGFEGEEVSLPPVEPAGDDVESHWLNPVEIAKRWLEAPWGSMCQRDVDILCKAITALRTRSAATPGQPALSPECQAKIARIRSDYLNDRALTVQQAFDMGWLLQTLTTLTEQRATPGRAIVDVQALADCFRPWQEIVPPKMALEMANHIIASDIIHAMPTKGALMRIATDWCNNDERPEALVDALLAFLSRPIPVFDLKDGRLTRVAEAKPAEDNHG